MPRSTHGINADSDPPKAWMIIGLLVFGAVVGIAFWRFQAMPAPDLVSFLKTGEELWSGRVPSDFMRAPLYGLIVHPLGLLMGSAWTAALLLNAVLYPCNLVLVYLILRRYLPKAALPLALLFAVNPYVVEMLTRTLCETLLIFLCLITLWLGSRGSIWAYLTGALAAITRYDAIGALLAVIVLDLIRKRTYRAIIAGLVSVLPLGAWMAGTYISLGQGGHVHYVQLVSPSRLFAASGWRNLFSAAIWPIPGGWVTIISGIAMVIYGSWITRRAWPLLVYAGTYTAIHLAYQFQEPRMYVPIAWVLPMFVVAGVQMCLRLRPMVSTVAISLVLAIAFLLHTPAVLSYGCRDFEFKELINWRKANIVPGQRIITSMADLLQIADPDAGGCYIPLRLVKGDIHTYCKDNGITYLVWDLRLLAASDAAVWYSQEVLSQWEQLAAGKDMPGWRYITTLYNPLLANYFIHIYHVQ